MTDASSQPENPTPVPTDVVKTPEAVAPSAPKSSVPGSFQWFVLQTLSNQEAKVKRYLEKFRVVDEMEDYLEDILMPTETVSEVKNGKKRAVIRKFYPGYVFVKMKLFGEDGKVMQKPWYFIQKVEGVIGFAGGENPQPLKEEEIERIQSQMKAAEGVEKPKVEYAIGQELRINDGPFLNLTGKVIAIAPDSGKLTLEVSIFGRMTPVELEYWQVSHAD
jgi:transcription termination/antitermination protein NusG